MTIQNAIEIAEEVFEQLDDLDFKIAELEKIAKEKEEDKAKEEAKE